MYYEQNEKFQHHQPQAGGNSNKMITRERLPFYVIIMFDIREQPHRTYEYLLTENGASYFTVGLKVTN